jgi:hypothetical protein
MILAYYFRRVPSRLCGSQRTSQGRGFISNGSRLWRRLNQHFIECLKMPSHLHEWSGEGKDDLRLARKRCKALEKIAKCGRGFRFRDRITLLEMANLQQSMAKWIWHVNITISCAGCAAESVDRSDQALAYERAGICPDWEANRDG